MFLSEVVAILFAVARDSSWVFFGMVWVARAQLGCSPHGLAVFSDFRRQNLVFGSRCLLSRIWDKDIPTSNRDKAVCGLVSPAPVQFKPILPAVHPGSAQFSPFSSCFNPVQASFQPIQSGSGHFPVGSGQFFFDNFTRFLPVHYGLDLFCSNSVRLS